MERGDLGNGEILWQGIYAIWIDSAGTQQFGLNDSHNTKAFALFEGTLESEDFDSRRGEAMELRSYQWGGGGGAGLRRQATWHQALASFLTPCVTQPGWSSSVK